MTLVPLAPFPFRPRRPAPRPIGPQFMNRKIVLLRGVAAAVALFAVASTVAVPPSAQAQPAALSASALRKVEVTVPVGKAQVLELPAPYVDLMISNPETADVLPLTRTSVYVVGKKLGSATLTAYGPGRQLVAAANVVISADVDSLRQRLHDTMPGEDGLVVGASNQSVVLSGPISSGAAAGRAVALAESFAPGQVVNMRSAAARWVRTSRSAPPTPSDVCTAFGISTSTMRACFPTPPA